MRYYRSGTICAQLVRSECRKNVNMLSALFPQNRYKLINLNVNVGEREEAKEYSDISVELTKL